MKYYPYILYEFLISEGGRLCMEGGGVNKNTTEFNRGKRPHEEADRIIRDLRNTGHIYFAALRNNS